MAVYYKILGQSSPSATTETDLYTAPSDKTCVVSSIVVCNRNSTSATFRISISIDGAVTSNKDYLYYDVTLNGNDTFIATVGLTLSEDDKIRIYSSTANLSFSVFGSEID